MKLLRFLERRLASPPPKSALHKWIRSGQVRVNGGRAKAFLLLAKGDVVRIPPFAVVRRLEDEKSRLTSSVPGMRTASGPDHAACIPLVMPRTISGPDLRLLNSTPALLVLAKASGLPCQPGSGHKDSVSTRLAEAFSGQAFIPAPAHRLDRDTSGIVLAGRSHECQQRLHDLFRHGGIRKEYLAWVAGEWPYSRPCLLTDRLAPAKADDGMEKMRALPGGALQMLPDKAALAHALSGRDEEKALSLIVPVQGLPSGRDAVLPGPDQLSGAAGIGRATLLLVLLLTGRKHQIRVQLASRFFPIIGDRRYGGPPFSRLLLHAHTIELPDEPFFRMQREYSLLPDWPLPYMPDQAALGMARELLREIL